MHVNVYNKRQWEVIAFNTFSDKWDMPLKGFQRRIQNSDWGGVHDYKADFQNWQRLFPKYIFCQNILFVKRYSGVVVGVLSGTPPSPSSKPPWIRHWAPLYIPEVSTIGKIPSWWITDNFTVHWLCRQRMVPKVHCHTFEAKRNVKIFRQFKHICHFVTLFKIDVGY